MEQVTITIQYGAGQLADLTLPQEVPAQILAEAVASAVGMRPQKGSLYTLALPGAQGPRPISPASTLENARVLCGAYLILSQETTAVECGAYLVTDTGLKLPLKPSSSIGRQDRAGSMPVDVDLGPLDTNKVVSRRHAMIRFVNNQYILEDTNSTNGTYLNGERIRPPQQGLLKDGDTICFGPEGRGVLVTVQCKGARDETKVVDAASAG
jgi:hypothetical protein